MSRDFLFVLKFIKGVVYNYKRCYICAQIITKKTNIMIKIQTKQDALKKINEIKNHPNVEIANFYRQNKTPWIYYYSLSGWFNGNYFSLYLNKMWLDSENSITEVEIVKSVSEKISEFRKQFKLPYNGKKKTN